MVLELLTGFMFGNPADGGTAAWYHQKVLKELIVLMCDELMMLIFMD